MRGTPKRMTLFRPFFTRGPKNSSSLLTPHLAWPGREGISTWASGSSVMKIGYMSMDFVRVLFACHDRDRGCWYPPCKTELFHGLHLCIIFVCCNGHTHEISMFPGEYWVVVVREGLQIPKHRDPSYFKGRWTLYTCLLSIKKLNR